MKTIFYCVFLVTKRTLTGTSHSALTIAVMVALTIADDKDVASQGKKWSSGSRRLLDGGERSLKTYFIMHLFRTEVNVTQLSKDSNLVMGASHWEPS